MKTIIDYKKEIISIIQKMENEHGELIKELNVCVNEEKCYTEPMTGEELYQRKYVIEIIF